MADFKVITYVWGNASCVPSLPRVVEAETALDAAQAVAGKNLTKETRNAMLVRAKAWPPAAPQEVEYFYKIRE